MWQLQKNSLLKLKPRSGAQIYPVAASRLELVGAAEIAHLQELSKEALLLRSRNGVYEFYKKKPQPWGGLYEF